MQNRAAPERSAPSGPVRGRALMAAVEVRGLVKKFKETTALAGVDLDVPEGSVLGLLGPNGAGKTTIVRILATLLMADAGTARVFGKDVVADANQVRAMIGLTGQYAAVDEYLTGQENLEMIGRLYHLGKADARQRASTLLERFDLADAAGRIAKTYSGGMRRRLDIAASLIARPRVLFLDEPTTGLDPRSRIGMWEFIALAGRRGHDHPAHHPVPGGGRSAGGQHRGDRPRQGHRPRNIGRAQVPGGRASAGIHGGGRRRPADRAGADATRLPSTNRSSTSRPGRCRCRCSAVPRSCATRCGGWTTPV